MGRFNFMKVEVTKNCSKKGENRVIETAEIFDLKIKWKNDSF